MKKRIIFTLISLMLMLSLLLSACKSNVDESSAEASDEISGEQSVETSEPPVESRYKTAVSIGKSYTGSAADNGYPDTYNSELTDGLYAEGDKSYTDPRWSNYHKPDPVQFVIDLGEIIDGIYIFEISYYHDLGPGIGTPQAVTVSYSDNGESWKGSVSIYQPLDSETGSHKMSKELDSPVSARYIRFSMSHYAANLFLDELTVYADVPGPGSSENVKKEIEEAYKADGYDYTAAVESLSTGKTNFEKEKVLLSKNKQYSASRQASEKYPDSGKALTNGAPLGATYESGSWVGFEGSESLEIVLDLGGTTGEISRFEISAFVNPTLRILLPTYIDVYAESSSEYIKIGRMYAPVTDGIYYYNYVLSLDTTISTGKIKFVFPEQSRSYLFLEEISVYSYKDAPAESFESFYRDVPIPEITKEVLFNSGDKDYNDRINLISGLKQTIYSYYPIEKGRSGNSAEDDMSLTDGKYAQAASYSSPGYFKFGSGEGRDVIYDLGATASVDGFSVSFLRQDSVGINPVSSVNFYLSEDGVNWYSVMVGSMPSENATEFLRFDYTLDRTYKARYARFSFRVWPNAYCDELQVWGTKKVDSAAVPLKDSGKTFSLIDAGAYTERDKYLGGANDTVLVPNYSAEDEKAGKKNTGYSKEELLAYAAYLDRDGNILDIMFDGFLFCPTGSALEGNKFYADANMKEIKDMIDKTFMDGRDIAALEEAVGEIKNTLNGLESYKAKFYIILAYPGAGVDFGDLDGDGVSDKLDTAEARLAAVKWAMDDFLSRYNGKNYKNIEFAGFYWTHESMNTNSDDAWLINSVADYAHSTGYDLFWIPYYKANGFDQWQHYGFDLACMQPNYAFDSRVGMEYVEYCAMLTRRLGMCVEMEITEAALTDPVFFGKYMEYLLGGLQFGYMTETVHLYYQDIYDYYYSCYSDDDKARLIYDYTYDFIKGTLKTTPEKEKDSTITVSADKMHEETFNTSGTNAISYELSASPSHGTVTVAADGSYCYYPQSGYKGTDTFSYVISNYLGNSAVTTVTVNIN